MLKTDGSPTPDTQIRKDKRKHRNHLEHLTNSHESLSHTVLRKV